MRLLIIRHAQPEPLSAASPDEQRPLDAAGRQQAACLAQALRGQKLDRVICSAMQRAVETATPLARTLGVPLIREPALAEINMGSLVAWGPAEWQQWEGVTTCWGAGDLAANCPEGESLADVVERVEPALDRLLAAPCRHGLAIVAHAVVNGVILSLLCPELRPALGRNLGHSLAGIWELEGDGAEFRALRRNDTSHLPSHLGHAE
jgi:broad specificity phosphatase PhoE